MGYDEPKSSVRKYPQSVSQMLTGDRIIELQDPLNDVGHDVTNDTGREADYQRA